jgi:ribosomal protein L24
MFQTNRWRIFPGDLVYVNHGPHREQSGKVLQVLKDRRVPQVLVEGVNLVRVLRALVY